MTIIAYKRQPVYKHYEELPRAPKANGDYKGYQELVRPKTPQEPQRVYSELPVFNLQIDNLIDELPETQLPRAGQLIPEEQRERVSMAIAAALNLKGSYVWDLDIMPDLDFARKFAGLIDSTWDAKIAAAQTKDEQQKIRGQRKIVAVLDARDNASLAWDVMCMTAGMPIPAIEGLSLNVSVNTPEAALFLWAELFINRIQDMVDVYTQEQNEKGLNDGNAHSS